MRGEEPQPYRDLALALMRRGHAEDLKEASQLLVKVISGTTWDVRFDQIGKWTISSTI